MNKGGEPPRCGYRYYRISPDYSVLEFTVGPTAHVVHGRKDEGSDIVSIREGAAIPLSAKADSFLAASL